MKYAVEEKNARYAKVCEELGWQVHIDGDNGYIENWSPAGENIIVDFSVESFAKDIISYARNFDVDEHVIPLIEMRGQRGVPKSIRVLVHDAEEIDDMLFDLDEALVSEDDLIDYEENEEDEENE